MAPHGPHHHLDRLLNAHPPPSLDAAHDIEFIRACAKDLGHEIIDRCPEGAEREKAIHKLREVLIWAEEAIVAGPPRVMSAQDPPDEERA